MAVQLELFAVQSPREKREQGVKTRRAPAQSAAQEKGAHLYVMQAATGRIKVGRSAAPKQRLADLQTGSGEHIRLVGVFDGRGAEEGGIHRELAYARKRGEWFDGSLAVQRHLSELLGRPLAFPYGDDGGLARGRRAREKARREAENDAVAAEAIRGILTDPSAKGCHGARLPRKRVVELYTIAGLPVPPED